MSASRTIVATLAGGVAIFVWGAVAHMALPLGQMGIKSLPAEEAMVPAMKLAIKERGFYLFPGMLSMDNPSEAEQKAWADKLRAGPRGVLIFDPSGGEALSMSQLGGELASNLLAAFILAVAIARGRMPPARAAIFGLLLGLFAWLSIDVSYWNWYRFPTDFALSRLIDQAVGGLVGGLVIALALGRPRATG